MGSSCNSSAELVEIVFIVINSNVVYVDTTKNVTDVFFLDPKRKVDVLTFIYF